MNNLLLEICITGKIPPWAKSMKNFSRKIKINWKKTHMEIMKEIIPDPIPCACWSKEEATEEYFKKYSEIKLEPIKKAKYKALYNQMNFTSVKRNLF
jgi:hypothetical protein